MKHKFFSPVLLVFLLMPFSSWAATYKQCFERAAQTYQVPYELLISIAFVESSFRVNARHLNSNGTADYGMMQINSVWRTSVGRFGFNWDQIKNNACTNIMFGASIMARNYARLKNWPDAIGAYNAGLGKSASAQARRVAYYNKVVRSQSLALGNASLLERAMSPGGIRYLTAENAIPAKEVAPEETVEEIVDGIVDVIRVPKVYQPQAANGYQAEEAMPKVYQPEASVLEIDPLEQRAPNLYQSEEVDPNQTKTLTTAKAAELQMEQGVSPVVQPEELNVDSGKMASAIKVLKVKKPDDFQRTSSVTTATVNASASRLEPPENSIKKASSAEPILNKKSVVKTPP